VTVVFVLVIVCGVPVVLAFLLDRNDDDEVVGEAWLVDEDGR